jgi:hypothetical protein
MFLPVQGDLLKAAVDAVARVVHEQRVARALHVGYDALELVGVGQVSDQYAAVVAQFLEQAFELVL